MSRVLVIDDDARILKTLAINLRARGYEVSLARSGEEGLQLAARHHPDAVILDLGLPDDGRSRRRAGPAPVDDRPDHRAVGPRFRSG